MQKNVRVPTLEGYNRARERERDRQTDKHWLRMLA